MEKIKWGIISTSNFAQRMILPSLKNCTNTEVAGIASRNLGGAEKVAQEFNIEKAYGAYEELLADADIDAVYIPLPNHLHKEYIKKALASGKHVLCEKPAALTAFEAAEVFEFSKGYPKLKLMEAFMYRLHPRWTKLKEIIASKVIGEIKHVSTFFSYHNVKPGNIRNIAEVGGGGLLDIGCYCISLLRGVFDEEPVKVSGTMEFDPDFKTDRLTSGILEFGNATGTFTCSTQIPFDQYAKIYGDKGRIEIDRPFTPELDEPTSIRIYTDDNMEEITIDACNHYTIEFDEFSKSIINDAEVPTPFADAVNNMKVIDAIIQSAENEKRVTL